MINYASVQPEFATLEQKLLSLGGNRVIFQGVEADLDKLIERGRSFSNSKVTSRFIEEHRAHSNVAKLWYESNGKFDVATGYALAPEGFWHQHSWAVRENRIIETTSTKREIYFGFVLTFSETVRFAFANQYPGFMEQLTRHVRLGGGFRRCVKYVLKVAKGSRATSSRRR